jgi:hypothetical protein
MRIIAIALSSLVLVLAPSLARAQSNTALGAGSGVVAGAVLGGPIGAVIGGVAGAAIGASTERPRYRGYRRRAAYQRVRSRRPAVRHMSLREERAVVKRPGRAWRRPAVEPPARPAPPAPEPAPWKDPE